MKKITEGEVRREVTEMGKKWVSTENNANTVPVTPLENPI